MKIQLLTFPGCPSATAARELVHRVLESSNVLAEIEEVDTASSKTPDGLRGWGSPTILIEGVDIEGQEAPIGASCRLYRDPAGQLRRIPAEATLQAAIARAKTS